jgi:hypothetical protein
LPTLIEALARVTGDVDGRECVTRPSSLTYGRRSLAPSSLFNGRF